MAAYVATKPQHNNKWFMPPKINVKHEVLEFLEASMLVPWYSIYH
ncbi:15911_t:CDS:2 [Cetraspora pellucida]|uniref:15911_t:CDS:1 n=1 Tax=Cetraspora pellucida TaxID=1433469 RepID=A0A9N9FSV7_9GLOM|nr:15911_t:CDS:2 [Cetraspora pellucida]